MWSLYLQQHRCRTTPADILILKVCITVMTLVLNGEFLVIVLKPMVLPLLQLVCLQLMLWFSLYIIVCTSFYVFTFIITNISHYLDSLNKWLKFCFNIINCMTWAKSRLITKRSYRPDWCHSPLKNIIYCSNLSSWHVL